MGKIIIADCIECYKQHVECANVCDICKDYGRNKDIIEVMIFGFMKHFTGLSLGESFRTREYGPLCDDCMIRHVMTYHNTTGLMKEDAMRRGVESRHKGAPK